MRPSPMDSLRRRCWRLRLPRRRRCSRCFWCGAPRRCRSRVAAPKTWTRVAVAVGRTYKELTGVPENLTQVIFIEVKHGNYFVGSVPPDTDQISVEGHLRTGRSLGTAQQLVEAFPDDSAPRYLLRDRDGIYGGEFRRRVKGMLIAEVLTAPRSPWQNPFVERVIGTIRRELLDHVIVLNEGHLRRRLHSYLRYYHGSRAHPPLEEDAPEPRALALPEHRPIAAPTPAPR